MTPVPPAPTPWSPPAEGLALRPIVRPGAPLVARIDTGRGPSLLTGGSVFVLGGAGIVLGPMALLQSSAWFFVGWAVVIGAVALAVRSKRRNVVRGPGWLVDGKPLPLAQLQALSAIDSRFAFAERQIRDLPTGLSWADLEPDVDALLWEAAEHANKVGQLDAELARLGPLGSSEAERELRSTLEQWRAQHAAVVDGVRVEAEQLALEAGRAAAAARLALAHTRDLAALHGVVPSRRAMVAAGALADARMRLALLADAWAELDDSGEARRALAPEAAERELP